MHDLAAEKKWFVEEWNTGLRYETTLPMTADFQGLYQAGLSMAGYIQTRIRRTAGRRS